MDTIKTPRSDQWLSGYDNTEMTLDAHRVMCELELQLQQANEYADRLVEHKDMVCLPADLENLRKANAHFAVENEMLKNAIANDRDAARTEGIELDEALNEVTEQRDRLAEDLNKMISICSCETEDIDTVNEIRYFVDTITKHSNP